jgi:hypothetical protein
VTEEAGRDSYADDLIALEGSDEKYSEIRLCDEESEAVRLLADLGFELISFDRAFLVFRSSGEEGRHFPNLSRRLVPRSYVPMLLEQLGEKIEEHPVYTGLLITAQGYVELMSSRLGANKADRIFRIHSEKFECVHSDRAYELPSLPFRWPDDGRQSVRRIHLSGRGNDPCIEISNASPLAMLFYSGESASSRVRLAHRRIPFLGTLKIIYGSGLDRDRLERMSEKMARSLVYELNVRNDVILELDVQAAGPDVIMGRRVPELSDRIRYPRTEVKEEVSSLFRFASQASDDPPSAFLSYYRTLEYFIPAAIRQSAMTEIKRELRDPGFDETNNESLLRLLKAAEGSIAAAEPVQLRILVTEYARARRLEEFFDHDWGSYFTAKGPIKGVPIINPKNINQSLPNQVADRVYQIRNRIVHAKDDPKYGNARVLLPQTAEANALTPDVLLVRLLATEAIATSQVF